MRKQTYVSLLCLLQLFACSEFGEQTEHGFDYHYNRQLGSPTAQIGDELYVQFSIRTDETVLFESPNGYAGMRTVLQDPTLNPIKDPDPIADVLPLMGEGDSVTVRMAVTEDMRLAFGLETAPYIYYDVALRQIVKEGEATMEAVQPDKAQNLIDEDALLEQHHTLLSALQNEKAALEPLGQLARFQEGRFNVGVTESGLFYSIIDRGGRVVIPIDKRVEVRHIGAHQDGLLVTESFTANPFAFTRGSGQVIEAWEEACDLISYGGKILLGVAPDLGYGEEGKPPYIGASDTLYYYFEVLE